MTNEMIEKAKTAKTPEELLAIAKENGIELTVAQAKEYYDKLNKSGELADDELDNVAAGGCGDAGPSANDENTQKEPDSTTMLKNYFM